MGTTLDRQTLTRMMADALAHQSKARVLGRELAKRLHAVVLNALREMSTDRTMPLWRMPPPDEVQLIHEGKEVEIPPELRPAVARVLERVSFDAEEE
jgi:hypothetical protein